MPSPVELHSVDRVYGRRSAVQAARYEEYYMHNDEKFDYQKLEKIGYENIDLLSHDELKLEGS